MGDPREHQCMPKAHGRAVADKRIDRALTAEHCVEDRANRLCGGEGEGEGELKLTIRRLV